MVSDNHPGNGRSDQPCDDEHPALPGDAPAKGANRTGEQAGHAPAQEICNRESDAGDAAQPGHIAHGIVGNERHNQHQGVEFGSLSGSLAIPGGQNIGPMWSSLDSGAVDAAPVRHAGTADYRRWSIGVTRPGGTGTTPIPSCGCTSPRGSTASTRCTSARTVWTRTGSTPASTSAPPAPSRA